MIPSDYEQRVYAGWLGKCIGVKFGAPLENWTYEEIRDNLGELDGYLREDAGKIFKPDDDTSMPMILIRALEEYAPDVTAEQIGETWLNYLGDQHGTLWWGGYGVSTEHTAYVNLANGIPGSRSGSMTLNGAVLAEQIGGQIFSDIWGLVAPGDPIMARELAHRAAKVSHDGSAVEGSAFIAALVSMAFVESDPALLIESALREITEGEDYANVVTAMLDFYRDSPDDWRAAFAYLKAKFGYDRYPGVVHVIPNAGIVTLALLYSKGDFTRSIQIANMCGWDTDCNVGNVGAIMGVAVGLKGIEARWREPLNDLLIAASVIGTRNILTIPQCVDLFCRLGRQIALKDLKQRIHSVDLSALRERERHILQLRYGLKDGKEHTIYEIGHQVGLASERIRQLEMMGLNNLLGSPDQWDGRPAPRYHFAYLGSTNNFQARGIRGRVIEVRQSDRLEDHPALQASIRKLTKKGEARIFTRTYYRPSELSGNYYGANFSPLIYPGQTMSASLYLPAGAPDSLQASLYIYDDNHREMHQATAQVLKADQWHQLSYKIPHLDDACVSEVGIVIRNLGEAWETGSIYLEDMDWDGIPDYSLTFAKERPETGAISQWSWLRGYWRLEKGTFANYLDEIGYEGSGPGLCETYTGDLAWDDYRLQVDLRPIIGDYHGINIRVQGASRSYALMLAPDGKLALYKKAGQYTEVAAADFPWTHFHDYTLTLSANGATLTATVEGEGKRQTLTWTDPDQPYLTGQLGLSTWHGSHTRFMAIRVGSVTDGPSA